MGRGVSSPITHDCVKVRAAGTEVSADWIGESELIVSFHTLSGWPILAQVEAVVLTSACWCAELHPTVHPESSTTIGEDL